MGTKDPVLAPYQTFETADSHINIACLNRKLWRSLCEAIDRPALAEDPRFETNADRVENMDALETEIQAVLSEHTTDEWMERLVDDAGIPAAPVQSVDEALHNEHTGARRMVTEMDADNRESSIPVIEHPLKFALAESGFTSPPPKLGEHNRKVFAELGYSEQEIDKLEREGAFGKDNR